MWYTLDETRSKMTQEHFVKVSVTDEKRLVLLKLGNRYHGVVLDADTGNLYVTKYASKDRLAVANKTRRYAKEAKLAAFPKPKEKTGAKLRPGNSPRTSLRLYTEKEMAQEKTSGLRFKEVWVLFSRTNDAYVADSLNKDKQSVVEYTKERNEAQAFKTYESAERTRTTLSFIGLGAHSCMRFFVDTTKEPSDE